MPTSFRKHGIILLILAVCVLCVTPVLADTYTPDFNTYIAPYTTEINGIHYLNNHVDISFINKYIATQSILMLSYPDFRVVLNIPGHGLFSNNEVIAETYTERDATRNYDGDTLIASRIDPTTGETISYYAHTALIDSLKPEMKANDLKWIDVQYGYAPYYLNTVWGHNYKP